MIERNPTVLFKLSLRINGERPGFSLLVLILGRQICEKTKHVEIFDFSSVESIDVEPSLQL